MTKEVRDLIKDKKIVVGMIVVPLFLFPLMGVAINASTQSAISASHSSSFALMNLDRGNYSALAVDYFSSLPNVTLKLIPAQPPADAMNAALKENVSTLVVIPPDFSQKVQAGERAPLQTYTNVGSFSVAQSASASTVSSVVGSFGEALSAYYVTTHSTGLNASVVLSPLSINESTFVKGELVNEPPAAVTSNGLISSIALPIATFIVLIFSMQIASAAMAVEKEQKTLETLLTFPVSRIRILGAKLVGSSIIAGMGAVTSIIGFTYYVGLAGGASTSAQTSAALSPSIAYYLALGVLLFLTLALATSMAIIVSIFASDVRSAQAVVGYLALPIILPTLLVTFGDLTTLPLALRAVVLAIPFSYVPIFASAGLFGDFTYALVGGAYLAAWVLGSLYLSSRFFSSERILTARFSFGRRKKKLPTD